MKLGIKIFISYLFIFAVCFYYPINWTWTNMRFRYLEGVEDPLVDQANILAAFVGQDMAAGKFSPEKLYPIFQQVYARDLSAGIYDILKNKVDIRIYITDAKGLLVFDSEGQGSIGEDYSKWRDVRLTLGGEYGARSTLENPDDDTSSVLYVAAPIIVDGQMKGVLTVGKPTTSINTFLENVKPRIIKIGTMAIMAAIFLNFLVSYSITLPIRRLTHYANDIRAGRRSRFPDLDHSEIGQMGKAFEKMQEALEGKQYVEHYVQTLTHEIKSPLSAIRGAAELLEEKMERPQRKRFLTNIHNETNRIQDIVDRLLELSSLENQKNLQKIENISFTSLIKTVIESMRPIASQKKLTIVNTVFDDIFVNGDSFLLHRAIANLVQNAVDFSAPNEQIELSAVQVGQNVILTINDHGAGFPDYATDRLFEKFFSLQRPDSGKKSTGLGLNFVKEVAVLHHGSITLENRVQGGVCARLMLPNQWEPNKT
ncbi:MAG: two-component system sensor histidine kinase CreC [Proteobacteria bacterium]|nr:two-component system sensor histidine kinase CreC [Pseudomonadota bacterium]